MIRTFKSMRPSIQLEMAQGIELGNPHRERESHVRYSV